MNAQAGRNNERWAPPFFTIWTGQAFSLLGSMLVSFALVWWLTQTTGSATVLATASLVGLIPQVLIAPLAGALVDRSNRRLVMIIADSTIAVLTFLLAVLFWLGRVEIWHIYVLMFLRSTAGGFHWPAMQASTSLMVPKEHLARIQGLNQVLGGAMNILSAPLGALLLSLMPLEGVLMIDVVTALLAVGPLLFISIPQPERDQATNIGGPKTTLLQDFGAGVKYMWNWPGLMIIGLMATVINFLISPAFSLLPILVTRHFGGQAFQLAALESTWGLGVVLGGVTLGVWGGFRKRIHTSLAGLLMMGVSIIFVGLAPSSAFVLAVIAMFLGAFANPICNGPLLAAVQAAVAPEMQGRVFTLINSFASAMTPIGLMIAGPLADQIGPNHWFVVGGIVTAAMGLIAFFIPAVTHFEDGRGDQLGAKGAAAAIAAQPAESAD